MTTRRAPPARHVFADLVVASDRPLPELIGAPNVPPDVTIEWRDGPPSPGLSDEGWIQQWNTVDDEIQLRLGRVDAGYLLEFPNEMQVVVDDAGRRIRVQASPRASPDILRHLMLHQVLPLVLSLTRPLVLHASAVRVPAGVVAFVGRAGSGKSTLAAACVAQGAALVADDCLTVARVGASWLATPSYPALRLAPPIIDQLGWTPPAGETGSKWRVSAADIRAAFEPERAPLIRVLLLPSPDISARASGSALGIALLSNLFRMDVTRQDESRRLFALVTDLAATVPVVAWPPFAPDEPLSAAGARVLRDSE